jgi:hypothetical protein
LQTAIGIGVTTTVVSGAAMFSGHRGGSVPLNVTENGLEHASVEEQRARDRHFAEYVSSHGMKSEATTAEMRQTYRTRYENASVEELTSDLIINQLLSPTANESSPGPSWMREKLRAAAGATAPSAGSSFMDSFKNKVAEDRAREALPPYDFMRQYPWLQFGERTETSGESYSSTMSGTANSIVRNVNRARSVPMVSLTDSISSSGDITARLNTLNVGSFRDRSKLVHDFMDIRSGNAERLTPSQMQRTFSHAWKYVADSVPGLRSETRDQKIALGMREIGARLSLSDCRSPEEVLTYLDNNTESMKLAPQTSTWQSFDLSSILFDVSEIRIKREENIRIARKIAGDNAVEARKQFLKSLLNEDSHLESFPGVSCSSPKLSSEEEKELRQDAIDDLNKDLHRQEKLEACYTRAVERLANGEGFVEHIPYVDDGTGILIQNPISQEQLNSDTARLERLHEDELAKIGEGALQSAASLIPFVGPAVGYTYGKTNKTEMAASVGLDCTMFLGNITKMGKGAAKLLSGLSKKSKVAELVGVAGREVLTFGEKATAEALLSRLAIGDAESAASSSLVKSAEIEGVAEISGAANIKEKITANLTPYGGPGGGHHIHSKAAYASNPLYDARKALCLSNEKLTELGIEHKIVTIAQQRLFIEFNKSGKILTREIMNDIQVKALIEGGASEELARSLVAESQWWLKSQGIRHPTDIPYKRKK